MESSWLFFLKKCFLCAWSAFHCVVLTFHWTWSCPSSSVLELPRKASPGPSSAPQRKPGGLRGSENAFHWPSAKQLQLQHACEKCQDANLLQERTVTTFPARWELWLHYLSGKWAMPVFGPNWFGFGLAVDIFHPLSLRKRRQNESDDQVLKIEDKNIIGGRSKSLEAFEDQGWFEVLALKISDKWKVYILVSDIVWKPGMY